MSAKKSSLNHDQDAVHLPSKEFSAKARIPSLAAYKKLYKESIDKPEVFWAREAKELTWQKPWSKVLDWKAPNAKWFDGGKLNVCENCVDRHATGARRNKAAIMTEGLARSHVRPYGRPRHPVPGHPAGDAFVAIWLASGHGPGTDDAPPEPPTPPVA